MALHKLIIERKTERSSQNKEGQFEEVRFKLRSARSRHVSRVRRKDNSETPCSQGIESGQCSWRTGGWGGVRRSELWAKG